MHCCAETKHLLVCHKLAYYRSHQIALAFIDWWQITTRDIGARLDGKEKAAFVMSWPPGPGNGAFLCFVRTARAHGK